jgi:hypothetical protein
MPDASGAPLTVLAPNHLADGLELAVALMWELSTGAAGGTGASEDHPTAVVLRGAIAPQDRGGFWGRTECKSKMDVQALQEEAVAVMRCEGKEGAFPAKL